MDITLWFDTIVTMPPWKAKLPKPNNEENKSKTSGPKLGFCLLGFIIIFAEIIFWEL